MVVDEELVAEFIARIAEPLDRLALEQSLTVTEATKFDLIGPDVLGEVARG